MRNDLDRGAGGRLHPESRTKIERRLSGGKMEISDEQESVRTQKIRISVYLVLPGIPKGVALQEQSLILLHE